MSLILYDCDICGGLHPWDWDGDCRDDSHRYGSPEEYAERCHAPALDVEVRSMEERVEAAK